MREPIGHTMMQAFPRLAASRSAQDTLLTGFSPRRVRAYGVLHELKALGLEPLELVNEPHT